MRAPACPQILLQRYFHRYNAGVGNKGPMGINTFVETVIRVVQADTDAALCLDWVDCDGNRPLTGMCCMAMGNGGVGWLGGREGGVLG